MECPGTARGWSVERESFARLLGCDSFKRARKGIVYTRECANRKCLRPAAPAYSRLQTRPGGEVKREGQFSLRCPPGAVWCDSSVASLRLQKGKLAGTPVPGVPLLAQRQLSFFCALLLAF
jgi:hypothetical protein